MTKIHFNQFSKYQKLFIVSGIVVSMILILMLSASFVIEYKIESRLEKLENLICDNLHVSWKCSSMEIDNFQLLSEGDSAKINFGHITISGFSLWDFLKTIK